MPRRPRIHQPGGFYHVTLRGNHQRDIFFSTGDRAVLNSIVAKAIEKYEARIHAYCWMSNHIHLLIQVGEAPLSEPMRQIAGEYARMVLSRLQISGHLFERRYFASLVTVDSYFLELVRYIHLNPVSARMVDDPASYRWSSHHNYLGRRHDAWVTSSFALDMFGSTREKAVAAYLEFVNSEDALDWRPPDDGDADPEEQEKLAQAGLHSLIAEACGRFGVSIERLESSTHDAYLTKVRGWIAAQARRRRIASIAEVARVLGRDEGALRYAMRAYPDEMD